MSRSNYSDDIDQWQLIRWRGAVNSAIKGTRGQAALRELAAAMDAMPDKRLISGQFVVDGAYCALGVLGAARGLNVEQYNDENEYCNVDQLADEFDLAEAFVREVMYMNDEYSHCTPSHRWTHMRLWVDQHLKKEPQP